MSDKPTRARFNGRAAWSRLTDDQKEEIGAIALEMVVNWCGADAIAERPLKDGWQAELRPFEAGDVLLNEALLQQGLEALESIEPSLRDDQTPVPIPSLIGMVCHVCGCSERDPCQGPCGWAADSLCTGCAESNGEQVA